MAARPCACDKALPWLPCPLLPVAPAKRAAPSEAEPEPAPAPAPESEASGVELSSEMREFLRASLAFKRRRLREQEQRATAAAALEAAEAAAADARPAPSLEAQFGAEAARVARMRAELDAAFAAALRQGRAVRWPVDSVDGGEAAQPQERDAPAFEVSVVERLQ
jgi:uncharacterized membrane protein